MKNKTAPQDKLLRYSHIAQYYEGEIQTPGKISTGVYGGKMVPHLLNCKSVVSWAVHSAKNCMLQTTCLTNLVLA